MPTITYHQPDDSQRTLEVEAGATVMRAALTHGVDGIVGECGGQAMCATCHVYVRPEYLDRLPETSEDEEEMLECTSAERTERSRLGCQLVVGPQLPELAVDVPTEQV